MPYSIHPVDGKWKVESPNAVHSKGTTKGKAKSQLRLLNAVEHSDWRPTMKGEMIRKKKKKPEPSLLK